MPAFQVVAAEEVRRLPEKEGQPPRAVVHMTLAANGRQVLITSYPKVGEPLPAIGSTLEGELGDPDRFDKDRRKFKRGGGGGFRKRDPAESHRIERQHSQHMALLYCQAKGIADFDFTDLVKLTDAFDRDLNPAPEAQSEVPFDETDLPPAKDITE